MPLVILGLGILLLLILILLKVKPQYALPIVSLAVGLAEQMSFSETIKSIGFGIYDTLKSMAIVLCLGAMLGKIIATGGAAQQITQTLVGWFGKKNISWAVMLTGFIVGIPLFYNAGFVILIPLIFSIAATAEVPLLFVGIPMAASLSVTHGFLPPHPGPTAIASIFHADLGKVLVNGLLLAVPAVILAGPLFAKVIQSKKMVAPSAVTIPAPLLQLPSKSLSFFIAMLPVAMIGIATIIKSLSSQESVIEYADVLGNPIVALGVALVLGLLFLGPKKENPLQDNFDLMIISLKEIYVIIFIIAAGGGFKQVLVDSGVGDYIKSFAFELNLSPLLLAWSVAALLRLSLGSATVAGLTASGIVLPMLSGSVRPELIVLAIGSGSLMFSHLNDTGFWMFKEYFNLTLKETFLSWSMMEMIISLTGLIGVILINAFT